MATTVFPAYVTARKGQGKPGKTLEQIKAERDAAARKAGLLK